MSSPGLHGSESLCRLLNYLTEQALQNPGGPVKEAQIARDVFGRPADFDPRLDAIVRVQTGRLRGKLTEYYSSLGVNDPVLIEIPRGTYGLNFQFRQQDPVEAKPEPSDVVTEQLPPTVTPAPTVVAPSTPENAPPAPVRDWRVTALMATSAVSLVLLAICAYFLIDRPGNGSTSKEAAAAPVLTSFWGRFADQPQSQPLIIYSNAEFIGRPDSGMRYFDPARDSRAQILDHYTGVGEVIAIHELSRLFGKLGKDIRVKRSRLLSLDDAKSNDLVFIGSTSENLSLREIPGAKDFAFQLTDDPGRKGDLAIVNLHPAPGERQSFLASPSLPLREDYALVILVPGLTPNRWIAVLAGTTTLGTQAAVEFVCRSNQLDGLSKRLGISPDTPMPPFEAVLHVKISGGVPVQNELVAVHKR